MADLFSKAENVGAMASLDVHSEELSTVVLTGQVLAPPVPRPELPPLPPSDISPSSPSSPVDHVELNGGALSFIVTEPPEPAVPLVVV